MNTLAYTITNASAKPAKAVSNWVTDKVAPSYWVPNFQILVSIVYIFENTAYYFGPQVYPRWSLVITLVRGPWSVCPSLNISETVHWFFLIFCMKLEHHKGTKVTEPDF